MGYSAFSPQRRAEREAVSAQMRARYATRRDLRHKPDPDELQRSLVAERLALSTVSQIRAAQPRVLPEPSLQQLAHACRVASRCVSNDALKRTLEIAAGYFDDAEGS